VEGSISLTFEDTKNRTYKKLILQDDLIVGGIGAGLFDVVNEFGILRMAIEKRIPISQWKSVRAQGRFNLAEVYSAYWS
jgi:NAD(P)H-nitrite reductase large subunit